MKLKTINKICVWGIIIFGGALISNVILSWLGYYAIPQYERYLLGSVIAELTPNTLSHIIIYALVGAGLFYGGKVIKLGIGIMTFTFGILSVFSSAYSIESKIVGVIAALFSLIFIIINLIEKEETKKERKHKP